MELRLTGFQCLACRALHLLAGLGVHDLDCVENHNGVRLASLMVSVVSLFLQALEKPVVDGFPHPLIAVVLMELVLGRLVRILHVYPAG